MKKGYTLLEFVIVITVLVILLGGSILQTDLFNKNKIIDNSLCDAANLFDVAISNYYAGLKVYPSSLDNLKTSGYIASNINLSKFDYIQNSDNNGYQLYALLSDGTKYKSPGSTVIFGGTVEFTVPGTYNWTIPEGTTKMVIELIGGAGGGSYADTASPYCGGGGGGGGAYGAWLATDAVAGTLTTIIVGNGGPLGEDGSPSAMEYSTESDFRWVESTQGQVGTNPGGVGGYGGSSLSYYVSTGSVTDLTMTGGKGADGSASSGLGGTGGKANIPIGGITTIPQDINYGMGGVGQSITLANGTTWGGTAGQSGYAKIRWF